MLTLKLHQPQQSGIPFTIPHPHFSEPLTLEGKPVHILWMGGRERRHLLTCRCWPTWISGHHSEPPRDRSILRYTLCSHSGWILCGYAPALQQICHHTAGCSGTARDLQGTEGWTHHTSITRCNGNGYTASWFVPLLHLHHRPKNTLLQESASSAKADPLHPRVDFTSRLWLPSTLTCLC